MTSVVQGLLTVADGFRRVIETLLIQERVPCAETLNGL